MIISLLKIVGIFPILYCLYSIFFACHYCDEFEILGAIILLIICTAIYIGMVLAPLTMIQKNIPGSRYIWEKVIIFLGFVILGYLMYMVFLGNV
jgi:hypothetical protein